MKSARDDYLAYINKILEAMETAERNGNSRELAKLRKRLGCKSRGSSVMPSKDLNGEPITSEKQLLAAWNTFLSQKFAPPMSDSNQHSEATVPPEDILLDSELEIALISQNW